MEAEAAPGDDAPEYWKLAIPRERILFVSAPGTEEFETLAAALEDATVVAMDAEWRPVHRAGASPRVSILQISCRVRAQSEAWARIDRVLLARKAGAEAEARLREERLGVERAREEVKREREEVERERKRTQEERRKVRAERENFKRERAEKKMRDRKEREKAREEREKAREEEEKKEEQVVDERPTLTKIQDGLKDLVLGRNGEISKVAGDLAGGVDAERRSDVTPKQVDSKDAEQNMDNLLDVLAQAQRELMRHEEGEQHTLHTEAKLETLSKGEEKPETNYAFSGERNLVEENGLTSKDTEIEANKVDRNFERNDLVSRGGEQGFRNGASGDGVREVSSNEQTGSDDEEDSDGDQEFSDAGENEFEMDKDEDEDEDSAPELVRGSKDGVGLTEKESERSKGEEVIFVLDLLALSAADFAFRMKKMLCSPRILKLGFAFKQDQIHLAASFPGPEAGGCFDKVEPYIDISKLYKQLLHANSAIVKHKGRRLVLGGIYSLTGISKAVLGHPLRKDAQCSDWEQRPLTEEQIYYAASDTHCLLAIFDTLLSDALAMISPTPAPAPAHTEAGDKPGLMIQQRASSLRDIREEGLKLLAGANNIREATSSCYIFTPKMSTASQMVEAALRPSPVSSPRGPVATVEQEWSGERFSRFVKKYSERLLVNEESRSKSHARRPRGRRAREALRNPDSNNELNLEWIGPAPWDVRIGGDGTPKFLCDVMVEGLARQLRCVGVDAASPPTKKSDPRFNLFTVQSRIRIAERARFSFAADLTLPGWLSGPSDQLGCQVSPSWQMVEQGMKEGRILLTKDVKLLRRRLMPENLAYFVKNLGKWEQLAEVLKVFQITVSESDLLSRCVKCNGEFTPRPLTSKEAKVQAPATQDVPKCVLETCDEFWQCSVCGHLFWQGFQFDRARQKFAAVCVKPNDDNSVPDDDELIQPLDIACEFLEDPEKAFALGGSSV